MYIIGLIREGKIPADNRVALTPSQCLWLQNNKGIKVIVQPSEGRCFADAVYSEAGIEVTEDMSACDILLGIKEVPVQMLLDNKKYMFFSHTKKKQPHNRKLLKACIDKGLTLIDYECLTHDDGQRIIGFGFFAGIVGAHNALWVYGKRTGLFSLPRVHLCHDYATLVRHYFELKLPNIKIALTGSGRVAQGVIDIMNLLGIIQVEPDEYLEKTFTYPVYVQLKGADLYRHRQLQTYKREHFHAYPNEYESCFSPYAKCADILINGVYWDKQLPRLFEKEEIDETFALQVIADITDDAGGSVPINLGEVTIEDPVYGVDKKSFTKTGAFLTNSIDIIAVGNLPNELPKDASNYFGEQLIKYVFDDLTTEGSAIIDNATMVKEGKLQEKYAYLRDYVL